MVSKRLNALTAGPIILKGIQTVSDAKKAVERGMAGIVVSNRGCGTIMADARRWSSG